MSEASLVREAVRQYLASASKPAKRRDNPLYKLIGLVKDKNLPKDMAKNHDYYLYDDYLAKKKMDRK